MNVMTSAGSTVDLHMHSIYSDGADDLPQLLQKVQEAGIRTFALSDHDTADGAVKMRGLVPNDIRFIPSVEFSCKYMEEGKENKWTCHLLGLGAQPDREGFASVLHDARRVRTEKMNWRFDALEKVFSIVLTPEQRAKINAHSSPGKPHIAAALTMLRYEQNGWKLPDETSSAGEWEQYRGCFQNVIQTRLNVLSKMGNQLGLDLGREENRPHMEPRRAIEGILAGSGVPVWAHPLGEHRGKFLSKEQVRTRLEKLCDRGLKALECYYSQYDGEETAFLLELAGEYGLLVSGGSDYHGISVKSNPLGRLRLTGEPVTEQQLTVLTGLAEL